MFSFLAKFHIGATTFQRVQLQNQSIRTWSNEFLHGGELLQEVTPSHSGRCVNRQYTFDAFRVIEGQAILMANFYFFFFFFFFFLQKPQTQSLIYMKIMHLDPINSIIGDVSAKSCRFCFVS